MSTAAETLRKWEEHVEAATLERQFDSWLDEQERQAAADYAEWLAANGLTEEQHEAQIG